MRCLSTYHFAALSKTRPGRVTWTVRAMDIKTEEMKVETKQKQEKCLPGGDNIPRNGPTRRLIHRLAPKSPWASDRQTKQIPYKIFASSGLLEQRT